MVLEPKVQFYDELILLLDFNSLYPSIIQEFNLCFTTVKRPREYEAKDEADLMSKVKEPPKNSGSQGILPRVVAKLIQNRKSVKSDLKKCKFILSFEIMKENWIFCLRSVTIANYLY